MGSCNCGLPKVEATDAVLDHGAMDEKLPMQADGVVVAAKQDAHGDSSLPVAPAAARANTGIGGFVGVWFHDGGSHVGRIDENGFLTWACGYAFPVTELQLNQSGEALMFMQGETYTGVLNDNKLHWSDGDTWVRGEDPGNLVYATDGV
mmetsp:Transcript_119880/g.339286  ORF Transcript_119880/g.339286 Transcript_119880/m.339286 type:complete len:149 (-) Transcript_119880:98-544(-)